VCHALLLTQHCQFQHTSKVPLSGKNTVDLKIRNKVIYMIIFNIYVNEIVADVGMLC
jgi:hypothetical protein